MRENEEHLLAMPFEVLLTQIPNLPVRFYLHDYLNVEDMERAAIVKLDSTLKEIKLPTMLLERLKKEFDQNFEVSKRTSSTNSAGSDHEPA